MFTDLELVILLIQVIVQVRSVGTATGTVVAGDGIAALQVELQPVQVQAVQQRGSTGLICLQFGQFAI